MPTDRAETQEHSPVEATGTLVSYGMPSDDSLELHPDDNSPALSLAIDSTIFGFPTKSALHWAAMLESPVILQLRADPEQPNGLAKSRHHEATLVSFKRADSRSIAQQIYDHLNGVALIPRITGLINYHVTTSLPSVYSNQQYDIVDLREIIVWKDDSISIIESKRSPFNGAITNGQLLLPYQSIRDTFELPKTGDKPIDGYTAHTLTQDMIDFANIVRATNTLVDRLNNDGRYHPHPVFRSMIRPAAFAAYHYQQLIIDFMKSDQFPSTA